MEKFIKLLDEYGLELDFVYKKHINDFEDNFDYMKKLERKENGFEGLMQILEQMMIGVKNYSKFYKKIGIPEKYKDIGPIVEKNICMEIKKTPERGVKSFLLNVEGEDFQWDLIQKILLKKPEKLGVKSVEFKLKTMYDPNNAVKNEIKRLEGLVSELKKEESIRKELGCLALEIKDSLKNIEDDPEWYLEYAKKYKLFKKAAEKIG